jgi:radical SAM superfamily enzyme YgiQ (UPF0313 family)
MRELEDYSGIAFETGDPDRLPWFGGEPALPPVNRSLSAVTLVSALERAGFTWKAFDPGRRSLKYWRGLFAGERKNSPKVVAVSTTFITNAAWLKTLFAIIRRALPEAKIVAGGYFYLADTREFFSLDADVLCVGEGEVRFPQIVKALVENDLKGLERIPGLYLRTGDGSLRHTGRAEQLDMNAVPRPDWSLAERIEPLMKPDDVIECAVETQRGCVFKCEFCTFRAMSAPTALTPEAAAGALLAKKSPRERYMAVLDSTATYPRERWKEIMRRMADAGGSDRPIWAFARVSDIDDEAAALMAKAGVDHVFIGQESGDQRVLNLMKKGTRVDEVRPAVDALGRHGIGATFSFIHGFPGEDAASMRATREMLLALNDGHEKKTVVLGYHIYPFRKMDFAAVSRRGKGAPPASAQDEISAQRAVEEVLTTIIEASKTPHAPPNTLFYMNIPIRGLRTASSRYEIFRWLKAVERGITIFLERNLYGKKVDMKELRALRAEILSHYKTPQPRRRKLGSFVKKHASKLLEAEWKKEDERGTGLFTRLYLSLSCFSSTKLFAPSLKTLLTGRWPDFGVNVADDRARKAVENFAKDLLDGSSGNAGS